MNKYFHRACYNLHSTIKTIQQEKNLLKYFAIVHGPDENTKKKYHFCILNCLPYGNLYFSIASVNM